MAQKLPFTILGIAGTNGSGKDSVGELLASKYGFLFVSVTDMLRDELATRGLPPAREHMRDLSAEWRRESGLGVLINKAVELYKAPGHKYLGLAAASLRNPGEVDRVHDLGGKVLWVDADPKIRYERVQGRGGNRTVDDQKSFEQFLADEQAEMEHSGDEATLNMAGVKDKSDYFLTNNGNTLEALAAEIKRIFNLDE
jgi:dephospho-CoA kinase